MARSARKSLADTAAAAAKKVIGLDGGSDDDTTASAADGVASAAPSGETGGTAVAVRQDAPVKRDTPPQKADDARRTSATKVAPATKAAARKAEPAKADTPPTRAGAGTTPAAGGSATSAASLAVKEGEDPWTDAELEEVVGELHEHRDRLEGLIAAQERELAGLMKDAGDGAGHDQADMGATSFERDHELTVVNQEREMLAQIERALARIDDGTYGVCESCGEPIGKMRVMAFPRATLCMPCKQREERR